MRIMLKTGFLLARSFEEVAEPLCISGLRKKWSMSGGQRQGDPSQFQQEERQRGTSPPGGVALWLPCPVKHQAAAKAKPFLHHKLNLQIGPKSTCGPQYVLNLFRS